MLLEVLSVGRPSGRLKAVNESHRDPQFERNKAAHTTSLKLPSRFDRKQIQLQLIDVGG